MCGVEKKLPSWTKKGGNVEHGVPPQGFIPHQVRRQAERDDFGGVDPLHRGNIESHPARPEEDVPDNVDTTASVSAAAGQKDACYL